MRSDRGYRDDYMRLFSMGGGLVLRLMSRLGGGFSLGVCGEGGVRMACLQGASEADRIAANASLDQLN